MDVERTVVVIPGRRFGPYIPQLFFTMLAATRRGAIATAIQWEQVEDVDELAQADIPDWVDRQTAPALATTTTKSSLVVGKSLGSYAAPAVAAHGIPAIWVTPLLTNSFVVDALSRASAPLLLVGGTADPLWDSAVARSLTPHVLELPGADHGLLVPGPLSRSADNMARLAEASESFMDVAVWPR